MKRKIIALILLLSLALTGCKKPDGGNTPGGGKPGDNVNPGGNPGENITTDDSSYGEDLEDLGAMDGYFDEEHKDILVRCVEGTPGAYKLEGNVLKFTSLSSDSVYTVSGKLSGSIIIDIGDENKLELELTGLSLVSKETSPITVLSGKKVTIQAKKETENFIYDTRDTITEDDTDAHSGAIFSSVDLEISGKGKLSLVSENNGGIHSKKDLEVKNLTLTVSSADTTLKGNDSLTLENATATIISTMGDCLKTTKSDVSTKGNQRGNITIAGGTYEIYAACDGIDAAYNAEIADGTTISIFTDKYSNYSKEITAVTESVYYIRFSNSSYKYSVKYYNSDSDYLWVNAEHHSTISGGRQSYYYYSFPKNEDYSKLQLFVYSSSMEAGQDETYVVCSDYITPSTSYDTIALSSRSGSMSYSWTNYTTSTSSGGFPGGPGGFPGGGFNDGNSDKGDHSTKGIKAYNEIIIGGGNISIKSYDDAIHSNNDTTLENGESPKGDLTINGGSMTIYSNDDGLHADGILTMNGGNISVINSYEGAEGYNVKILGGRLSIISKDDGINATATTGTSITIGGGELYVFAGGDGVDSNSRTSYSGIAFTGGKSVIISTSGGNSAIDSEQGYSYSGGSHVAIMPRGGMSSESTHCQNFQSIGKKTELSLTKGQCLSIKIGSDKLTLNMPASLSALVITLGDSGASVTTSASGSLGEGEYIWN